MIQMGDFGCLSFVCVVAECALDARFGFSRAIRGWGDRGMGQGSKPSLMDFGDAPGLEGMKGNGQMFVSCDFVTTFFLVQTEIFNHCMFE